MLCVIEDFPKLLEVMRNDTVDYDMYKLLFAFRCNSLCLVLFWRYSPSNKGIP